MGDQDNKVLCRPFKSRKVVRFSQITGSPNVSKTEYTSRYADKASSNPSINCVAAYQLTGYLIYWKVEYRLTVRVQ